MWKLMSGCKSRPDVTGLTFTAIVFLMCALASTTHAQDFNYIANADSITITGYAGAGGDIVIPDTINSLPVTTIRVSAFRGKTNLTSVTIGSSVTSIGDAAFMGCNKLTSITLPNNVTTIGRLHSWVAPV